MNHATEWLEHLDQDVSTEIDGLVPVKGYQREGRHPEEVAMMERAAHYGADAVFFEASRNNRPAKAPGFYFRLRWTT